MDGRSDGRRRESVERARQEFDRWRSWRSPGCSIPERLWKTAVDLARNHGVSKTARELRLSYYSLRERVEGTSQEKSRSGPREPRFLELPLGAVAAAAQCVLELEDREGTRLRIAFQGQATSQIEPVARSLWSGTR